MNRYYIQVNENRHGFYDFVIELYNENTMLEKATLGTRDNIDTLGECFEMIDTFPLSETSVLEEVQFNRRSFTCEMTRLEQIFIDDVNSILDEKDIKSFVVK